MTLELSQRPKSGLKNPARPIAVITGTSRDVGYEAALEFARSGFDIVGGHQRPKSIKSQEELVGRVGELGGRMVYVEADLKDSDTPDRYLQLIKATFGDRRIKTLVLNAAGGWKAPLEEARSINVLANLRLLEAFMPYFDDDSVTVFNTSGPAHEYHTIKDEPVKLAETPVDYHPVMISKNEMEAEARKRIPQLLLVRNRLAVVVGNALEGTFVTRALKRGNQALMADWVEKTGSENFPDAHDMGAADVAVVLNNYPSGYTEYVGIEKSWQLFPGGLP